MLVQFVWNCNQKGYFNNTETFNIYSLTKYLLTRNFFLSKDYFKIFSDTQNKNEIAFSFFFSVFVKVILSCTLVKLDFVTFEMFYKKSGLKWVKMINLFKNVPSIILQLFMINLNECFILFFLLKKCHQLS